MRIVEDLPLACENLMEMLINFTTKGGFTEGKIGLLKKEALLIFIILLSRMTVFLHRLSISIDVSIAIMIRFLTLRYIMKSEFESLHSTTESYKKFEKIK